MNDNKVKAVSGIIKRHGKILLLDHVKCNSWMFPGGKVENNETFHDGIVRELFEELDIIVNNLKVITNETIDYNENRVIKIANYTYFEVVNFSGTIINKEPLKHKAVKWFTIAELKALSKLCKLDQTVELLLEKNLL